RLAVRGSPSLQLPLRTGGGVRADRLRGIRLPLARVAQVRLEPARRNRAVAHARGPSGRDVHAVAGTGARRPDPRIDPPPAGARHRTAATDAAARLSFRRIAAVQAPFRAVARRTVFQDWRSEVYAISHLTSRRLAAQVSQGGPGALRGVQLPA